MKFSVLITMFLLLHSFYFQSINSFFPLHILSPTGESGNSIRIERQDTKADKQQRTYIR